MNEEKKDLTEPEKRYENKITYLESKLSFFCKGTGTEVGVEECHRKMPQNWSRSLRSHLTESLKITTEEKIILEDELKNSTKKLGETENILDILQNELNITPETLESIECDLKASGMRETEVMEKLKFAEEQIEKHEVHRNKLQRES